MKRSISLVLLLLNTLIANYVLASSTVYEISEGNNKIYLAGTIHLLRNQDFPLPAEFDAAYRQSHVIYFETDLQKAKGQEFGQRFARAMTLPNNTTLKDVLNVDTWVALNKFADETGFPLNQTMTYNAAMVGILITLTESKKLSAGDGVDAYFDTLARSDNKMLGELETGDDVITYMKSFANEDPNKIINSTLNDAEHIGDELEEMIDAWKIGNLGELDKNMGQKMRNETPDAYKTLMLDRNKKWLPKIQSMFKTPEVEMVLVGSLHLSGNDGLLVQLKKLGYTVKPYQLEK